MPIARALCLTLAVQCVGALRKSARREVAGVPMRNYRYRHLQVGEVGTAQGTFDWVMKFQEGVNDQQIMSFCSGDAGIGDCRAIGHPSGGGVPFATVRTTEEKLEKILQRHPSLVEWVEPDTSVEIEPLIHHEVQKDDVVQKVGLWGHKTIGLDQTSFTGNGVHVYVMDSGIRNSHIDFEGRVIPTIDTLSTDNLIECNGDSACALDDYKGHGTVVAGTLGGKTYGVAKKATLYSMKVCCNTFGTSSTEIIKGMDWIAQKRSIPAVMAMSIGWYETPESSRLSLDAVVASGVTVIVSAGNRDFPSCDKSYTFIRSAIGVGASTSTNQRASWSNFGECNAIFAPGSQILTTAHDSDDGTRITGGTSMAAPHVAGVAAMLLEENPTLSPEEIRAELQGRAQVGMLSDLKPGDPNLLLWAGSSGSTPAPQPTPTPTPTPQPTPTPSPQPTPSPPPTSPPSPSPTPGDCSGGWFCQSPSDCLEYPDICSGCSVC